MTYSQPYTFEQSASYQIHYPVTEAPLPLALPTSWPVMRNETIPLDKAYRLGDVFVLHPLTWMWLCSRDLPFDQRLAQRADWMVEHSEKRIEDLIAGRTIRPWPEKSR